MIQRLRRTLLFAVATLLPALPAQAQHQATTPSAGPRMDASAVGLQRAVPDSGTLVQSRSNSVGKPLALMIVGGAALVLGMVIDGDVGTLFMIGGAVALLWGLYHWLK